ncbi:MAG: phage tail protein [Pseudomonadota bacterium]
MFKETTRQGHDIRLIKAQSFQRCNMPNRRDNDHLVAFNFSVEIEGVFQGAATYVGGLSGITDVVDFKDGNTPIRRQRPGRTTYGRLIIRRGYTNDDAFYTWWESVRNGVIERKSGSIILMGDNATEIARFNFFEAWPARWELLPLDSNDDTVLEEELEIVVERIDKG